MLAISVLVYRDEAGQEHFVAVRGGILTVSGRSRVEVATREAVASDEIEQLEQEVLARFRRSAAADERASGGLKRLEGTLLRRVAETLRLEHTRSLAASREPPWHG